MHLAPENSDVCRDNEIVCLPGVVTGEEFLGANTKYRVDLDGEQMISLEFGGYAPLAGDRVKVFFKKSNLMQF